MQSDLIDVANLSQKNKDIKFVLTIICCFTKKHWFFAYKIKNSDVVLKAFKGFMLNIDKVPRGILMDAGNEFVLVRKFCAENNIETYLRYSSFHESFIERFN